MTLDDLLRTAAHEVADAVPAPTLDARQLRDAARRTQRRRRSAAATAGAAVLVGGVLTGVGLVSSGRHDPQPAPPAYPTPTPAPHSAPVWSDADGVHVGARTFPTGTRVSHVSVTAEGVVYDDEADRIHFQPLAGGPPHLLGTHRGRGFATDSDGSTVAWFEEGPDGPELVLHDLAEGREVGRAPARRPPGWGSHWPNGDRVPNESPIVLVDGTEVVHGTWHELVVQDPAAGTLEIVHPEPAEPPSQSSPGRPAACLVDRAPHLTAVSCQRDEEHFFQAPLAFVDAGGTVASRVEGVEPSGAFNHDGTRYATVISPTDDAPDSDQVRVVVVDTATGEVHDLVGLDGRYPLLGWGVGDVLMVRSVDLSPPHGPVGLLACDVVTESCTRVVTAGDPWPPQG